MQAPNCFTQVGLPDTSPLVLYSPSEAWYAEFSSSNDAAWQPGMLGAGLSIHGAADVGSTATFEYPGISSEMTGQLTGGSGVRYLLNGAQRTIDMRASSGNVSSWSAASGAQDAGVHNASVGVVESAPGFLMSVRAISSVVGIIAET
jgi:hypothetical protein